MAEMKFNCPGCQQLIACDELWIGQEIQCPICAVSLTVPSQQAGAHNPLVPKPPAGAGPKLSIGQPRHPSANPPPAPRTTAPRPGGHVMGQKAKKSGAARAKTFAIWGLVLGAVGAGVYFGWPYLKAYQDKMNSKSQQEAKNSDGGQVGHIAELNGVLDATDPDRRGGPRLPSDAGRVPRPGGGSRLPSGASPGQPGAGGVADTNLPVVPALFTLDIAAAKIPEGRVNGMISGTNFVADSARLDLVGGSYLLRLSQGPVAAPERQFLVYLRLKAGETLAGHTWNIASDMKGGPSVSKLWKPNPKYAAKTQGYSSGYTLKLELGEIKDGQVPGKIYVALPDTEQSYAGGVFLAQTTVGTAGAATVTPSPAAPVVPSGQTAAEKAAFEKRYGIKR